MPEVDPRNEALLEQIQKELLGGRVATGRAEISRIADLEIPMVTAFWHALGFPVAQADSGAFSEADVTALSTISDQIERGTIDKDLALMMTRAVARTTDRLSVWQTQLVAESLLAQDAPDWEGGVDRDTAVRVAQQLCASAEVFEPLLTYAWRRHLLAALTRMVSDTVPDDPGAGPVRVVGFADLVNFSAYVRRATERELALMVMRFERLASDIVTAHGGRVIKTVGDEVLFVAVTPLSGTAIGLDLVDTMAEEEMLPAVRVGLAYGPVVSRLGDVFGTTVNRASRLTAVAGAGRVLADEPLATRLDALSGFRLKPTRRRHLRGIGAVTASEVTRSSGERRG